VARRADNKDGLGAENGQIQRPNVPKAAWTTAGRPNEERTVMNPRLPWMLLACCAMLPARAEIVLDYRRGTDPSGYRSDTWGISADSKVLPLDFSLDHFSSNDDTRQRGAKLKWTASDALTFGYRYTQTKDSVLDMLGHELNASYDLDGPLGSLWSTTHAPSIDFAVARYRYTSSNALVPRDRSLSQKHYRLGLTQAIGESLSLSLVLERYSHDPDARQIALLLLRRSRNTSLGAYTLLSFPDRGESINLHWQYTPALTLSLDTGRTRSVLDQDMKYTRAGLDYRINTRFSINLAQTRSSSTRLATPLGVTLQAADSGRYYEAGVLLSW
jgi:hypothetical protein